MISRNLVMSAALILALGCGKKKSDDKELVASESKAGEVGTNMQAVAAGFAPASLAVTSTTLTLDGTTCTSGPFAAFNCQPLFLKGYLDLSKKVFTSTMGAFLTVKTSFDKIPDGGKGTFEDATYSYEFRKTDETHFELLMKKASVPVYWLKVEDGIYHHQFDFDASASAGVSGRADIKVTFTDITHWKVDLLWTGIKCLSDANAPRVVAVKNSRDGDIWKGKSMLFNPSWKAQESTCPTETPAASEGLNMYTDYIATEEVAKGNVYALDTTVAAVSEVHALSETCVNYPSKCGGDYNGSFGTTYGNAFCAKPGVENPTWNVKDDNCTAISPTLGAATFGPASDWIAPTALHSTEVTLPTALD